MQKTSVEMDPELQQHVANLVEAEVEKRMGAMQAQLTQLQSVLANSDVRIPEVRRPAINSLPAEIEDPQKQNAQLECHTFRTQDFYHAVGVASPTTSAVGGGSGGGIPALRPLFLRYDLENSQTINTREELEQLTVNAIFQLKCKVLSDDIPPLVDEVVKNGEFENGKGWDFDRFCDWFGGHFIPPEGQEEKDLQNAGVVFSKPDENPVFKRSVSNCSSHSDMGGGVVLGQCLIEVCSSTSWIVIVQIWT